MPESGWRVRGISLSLRQILKMEINSWFGRLAVFVSLLAFVVIRWPHGNRYKSFQVVVDRKGRLRAAFESTEPGWKEKVVAVEVKLQI